VHGFFLQLKPSNMHIIRNSAWIFDQFKAFKQEHYQELSMDFKQLSLCSAPLHLSPNSKNTPILRFYSTHSVNFFCRILTLATDGMSCKKNIFSHKPMTDFLFQQRHGFTVSSWSPVFGSMHTLNRLEVVVFT